MHFTSSVLGALALLASRAIAESVLELTPKNFDSEILAGTPALVEFFAPWCGHCKSLAPVYEELATSFSNSAPSKVKIAKVDVDAHKELGTKYGISGFPTLKWFDGSDAEPSDYKGGRDLEALQEFVQEKSGVRPKKAPKPPSYVEMLNDRNFDAAIGKDKDVFVAFTAPWCGHCKSLAPIWEKLAEDFVPDNDNVVIAKVDAEVNKKVAEAQSVSSYPTIKFFPKGSTTPLDYQGGRDEKTLVEYVNEQAGTHRVAGGGLDIKAGTIAALDAIVARVNQAGEDLAGLTEEAKKAAKDTKTKSAEYYVKVLDKIAGNKGYLEKERARLEGLLKKGGIVREKEDDLTRRLNILKRFAVGNIDFETVKEEL